MTTYLPDATDFTDMPVKADPAALYPDKVGSVLCSKCHGHGGWNLRLNAYGKPDDPPDLRHFRAFCRQCWGWGWVRGTDATCVHDFKSITPDQLWRCWHTIQCVRCGTTKSYSSDD